MSNEDSLDVVKQIGQGSFSKVYLCKRAASSIFGLSKPEDFFFIVKEINIDSLVTKYMKNGSNEFVKKHRIDHHSPMVPMITPYDNGAKESRSAEEDYYYKRLEELIESEIEVLHLLNHENVIKIFNATRTLYNYNLHMEYCELGDVYQYIKKVVIDKHFVNDFVKQVSHGIEYIHENNIIHRDIKLQNILITLSGSLVFKISDFGFACFDLTNIDKNYEEDDIIAKKYYKLCGTPLYMAPEIILNMQKLENITSYKPNNSNKDMFYDKSIDAWSFGICLYELIHKMLPFDSIKNIKDLKTFYEKENVQMYFDRKVKKNKVLKNLLQIDAKKRCLPQNGFVDISSIIEDLSLNESNESMKKHVISSPVKQEKESLQHSSWHYINKSSALLEKMSVTGGFLEWLMKKS